VQDEEELWFLTKLRNFQVVVITGNPVGQNNEFSNLEHTLSVNLSAVVINEERTSAKNYLRAQKKKKGGPSFPYPNPIKLLSREA